MKGSKKNSVLLAVAVLALLLTNVLVLASVSARGQSSQEVDKKIQALVLQLTDQQKQILMVNQNNLVQAHDVDLKSWKAMLESIQTEQKEILALAGRVKAAGR